MTQEQGPERPDDLPVDEGQAGNADGPSPESPKGAQATEDEQRGRSPDWFATSAS